VSALKANIFHTRIIHRYDDVMNKVKTNGEAYCVITDRYGNQVTVEVITIQAEK